MECLRLRAARCTLFIAALLFAVYPPPLFSQAAATTSAPTQAAAAAPATTSIEITSSPSTGVPGNSKLELTIQPSDPKICPSDVTTSLTLVVPPGNGIDLLPGQSSHPGCLVIADISIEKGAVPNTTVMLRLQDAKGEVWGKPFPFNISTPPGPGPIPPGMKPTVDVMWGVVPDEIVHDEFGHYVSKKFFCIEVVIGNDTGYPVQIVSVGFTMDGKSNNYEPFPSSGYETTRAMLEVGQDENPRSYVLGTISLISSISTAGIPFFLTHKSFAAGYNGTVAALSSPFTNGIKVLWPDLTIPELNRLDNQILRDGLLIPNNTQVRTVVFVPKLVVSAFLKEDTDHPPPPQTECAQPGGFWHLFGLKCLTHTDTKSVMDSLGTLKLIGNEVKYINRVQVSSTPNAPSVSLTPSSLAFTNLNNAPLKVVLENTGTAPLNISKIDPAPGTSADDFSQSSNCPTPPGALAQGANCTITVTFTPTAAGKHQATLSISDDAANSPQTVSLTADWSPTLTAVPPDFTANPSKDMTITNNTNGPLTIKSIDPTGGQASDFTLGDNKCQTTLAAGKPCSTAVQFKGSGKSEQTTLDIRDNNGNLIGLVSVTGPPK